MVEIKGYTCDGGCGATTMVERSHESVTVNGWFLTFTPDGYPTLYTCSPTCLIRAVQGLNGSRTLGLYPT